MNSERERGRKRGEKEREKETKRETEERARSEGRKFAEVCERDVELARESRSNLRDSFGALVLGIKSRLWLPALQIPNLNYEISDG